jgi:hypothetical protein
MTFVIQIDKKRVTTEANEEHVLVEESSLLLQEGPVS